MLECCLEEGWGVWMCGSESESVCACLRVCICVYVGAFEKIESVRIMAMVVKRKEFWKMKMKKFVYFSYLPTLMNVLTQLRLPFVDIKPTLST